LEDVRNLWPTSSTASALYSWVYFFRFETIVHLPLDTVMNYFQCPRKWSGSTPRHLHPQLHHRTYRPDPRPHPHRYRRLHPHLQLRWHHQRHRRPPGLLHSLTPHQALGSAISSPQKYRGANTAIPGTQCTAPTGNR
jgi:hypothetical protein